MTNDPHKHDFLNAFLDKIYNIPELSVRLRDHTDENETKEWLVSITDLAVLAGEHDIITPEQVRDIALGMTSLSNVNGIALFHHLVVLELIEDTARDESRLLDLLFALNAVSDIGDNLGTICNRLCRKGKIYEIEQIAHTARPQEGPFHQNVLRREIRHRLVSSAITPATAPIVFAAVNKSGWAHEYLTQAQRSTVIINLIKGLKVAADPADTKWAQPLIDAADDDQALLQSLKSEAEEALKERGDVDEFIALIPARDSAKA